ncbi:MAG: serine/threonine protein kinase [Bradymonadaceae bacterium]
MLINRTIGNYNLLCRLAVGGQSEVFLAMKSGPGEYSRPVVIKALPTRYRHDPKFVELFHREAFLSSRFSHPNVVTVHDARILDGEQCMIMDFISGQTVADIAQRGYKAGSPPSTQQAVRIVADACDGLDYTHDFRSLDDTEYNVVHRDVSPQNLMVTYQGVTIVFDYGIAKIMGESSSVDTLVGGKYAYMSPEQCLGDEVDTRSDIFSLGVILYELTVGTRLFRRPSKDDVIEAVTQEEIKPPGELRSKFPPMLEDIVMKALQRDPDRRYQTAGRMRDDLRDYLAVQGSSQGREALGDYIAGLFEDERTAIAEIIQAAQESDEEPKSKNGIPLEKLGRGEDLEKHEDPEVPMPEPESDEDLAEEGSRGGAGGGGCRCRVR